MSAATVTVPSGHVLTDPLLSNEAFDRDRDPRLRRLRWNGWGFKATYFEYDPYKNIVHLHLDSGPQVVLPALPKFFRSVGLDPLIDNKLPQEAILVPEPLPAARAFLEALQTTSPNCYVTQENTCRLFHSHGHTAQEIWALRYGTFKRVVDAVVYPSCEGVSSSLCALASDTPFAQDVVAVVHQAAEHNAVLIPFGGGTSVTLGLLPPPSENRAIISVDMGRLCEMEWIDTENRLACIQAGATGQQIEEMLNAKGYTLGHEPDSHEFSTLGGWVATKASGMKQNKYGNVEDIVVDVSFVTMAGTINQDRRVARVSSGPDILRVILGSEGTVGIVIKAICKIWDVPKKQIFESIVFPSLDHGLQFLRDVSLEHAEPASLRLVDNLQVKFGMALRPKQGIWQETLNWLKLSLLTNVKGYDMDKIAMVTAVIEGDPAQVKAQHSALSAIAKKHNGICGGQSSGRLGYKLTFMIAYVRDICLDCNWIGESFETSVPWTRARQCYDAVLQVIQAECDRYKVGGGGNTQLVDRYLQTKLPPFVTGRVSQIYHESVCLYFYFGFPCQGLENPLEVYSKIEAKARSAIMDSGGSVSHHHGIGKLRTSFLTRSVTKEGVGLLKNIKDVVDPRNNLGGGNLLV